jgi:hypothetical protein
MSENIGPNLPFFKPDLSVEELAAVVRDEISKAKTASANALAHGIEAGLALCAAQQKVPIGGWKKWLGENCSIGESTARLYMRLAEHRAVIEAEIARGVDLSLRAARLLISAPKPPSLPRKEALPAMPAEPETLFAHWTRCPEEQAETLDLITIHGIRQAASPKFSRQLCASTPSNPFAKLVEMDPADVASRIIEAVGPVKAKLIAKKLEGGFKSVELTKTTDSSGKTIYAQPRDHGFRH